MTVAKVLAKLRQRLRQYQYQEAFGKTVESRLRCQGKVIAMESAIRMIERSRKRREYK